MTKYYLAVDIGASSGRHILGYMEQGKLKVEEVYRFENGIVEQNGSLCWNVKHLFQEIINGLKRCSQIGKIPSYMGIDTWAVDFVLLDADDKIIGETVAYRDGRTQGMDELVYQKISLEDLYERTGIQKQIFNTIYQLMAVKEKQPQYIEQASNLLMIADYFHFLLTGVKKADYTNATTTQLVHAQTKDWDDELIHLLGFKREMFQDLAVPGTKVGNFTSDIQQLVGFNCEVILPATHDTASAVVAVPTSSEDTVYLSSGTWSLMGVERMKADCSLESMKVNFTNEGGYDYRFRYLKNIMGLWMIQSLKRELKDDYSFAQLCEMASKETISTIVDCQDEKFLAPESMIGAIQTYCEESKQTIPQTPGELAAVIYNSLAECYAKTMKELEELNHTDYSSLHIIGGGANAEYLNVITADRIQKDVYAGPTEATAVGNLIVQMLSTGVFEDLQEARHCVYESFEIKKYKHKEMQTC